VPHAEQVVFGIRDLAWARAFAVGHTSRLRLPSERLEDVALAVGEIATNSIRHGGGSGVLRIWADDGHVVCEVRDGDPAALPRAPVITDRVRRSSRNFFDCSRIGRDPVGIRWV
jgi:anti-sigma regulatory factor (Ser/Thr protein kinase)